MTIPNKFQMKDHRSGYVFTADKPKPTSDTGDIRRKEAGKKIAKGYRIDYETTDAIRLALEKYQTH